MQLIAEFSGATVRRVIDRSHTSIPEHAHAWPLLSLYVLGGYFNRTEAGEVFVDGPSAVFYRAGAAHRNTTSHAGFEQLEIEFDPAWLGRTPLPDAPVARWVGGRMAGEARNLARLCIRQTTEEENVRAGVKRFLEQASRVHRDSVPHWIGTVRRRLHEDPARKADALAKDVGRHSSWLGEAYKRATGEGLLETAARLRVERAARLLRETNQNFAAVAADAGFCDQSHMNRTFRRVLDRLPSEVREDRHRFRAADEARLVSASR